jgi:ribonucleoside-diphosphate reductase alpha chain
MSLSQEILNLRYAWDKGNGMKETWEEVAQRVVDNVLSVFDVQQSIKDAIYEIIVRKKFIPGGRFLAQAGRKFHQVNNCFLLRAEDSREGWGELMKKASLMLMSGGGVGVDYSQIRPYGSALKSSGGTASGPLPLMNVINEIGRGVMCGGKRRSAIWGGLSWKHDDIFDFIKMKNWQPEIRKLKEKDFNFPATMDMTNISVILDKEFFEAFEKGDEKAQKVYWDTVERMCKTGEPGFSIDYDNPSESLRNACTEIVSENDCDVCCLGSINLANISNTDELEWITELAMIFLLCGTEYSDVPYPLVKNVREKNRRTGLGLMGIHEWLILRGYQYEANLELGEWLRIWQEKSDEFAEKWANKFSINVPIKKRAIAPTGSISIIGETTSGIEPIFGVAYLRRYLTPSGWKEMVVIDPVAERLVNLFGINPDDIEDSFSLAQDVKRRIEFQAFVQKYVDNAISSTINLPAWGSEFNNDYEKFGKILLPFLKHLRGITVYPDGARGGQPLTRISYKDAIKHQAGYEEVECQNGVCGL